MQCHLLIHLPLELFITFVFFFSLAISLSISIQGTTYVYDSFFRPYVAKHETEIDRSLLEMKTRAGDLAFMYWQKSASYAQTRVFDILQFVAAQSTPKRSAQVQYLCIIGMKTCSSTH